MRSNKMMWTLAWTLTTFGVLAAAGWQVTIAAPQSAPAASTAPAGNSPAAQNPRHLLGSTRASAQYAGD